MNASVGYLRSRMDLEGPNFIVAPTHGLEGGVVIAQLTLTAQEVLTLKDSHAALSVVLQSKHTSRSNGVLKKNTKQKKADRSEE